MKDVSQKSYWKQIKLKGTEHAWGKKHKHTTLLLAFVIPYYISMSSWFRPLHRGKMCAQKALKKKKDFFCSFFMLVDVSNGLSSVEQETILHFVEQERSLLSSTAQTPTTIQVINSFSQTHNIFMSSVSCWYRLGYCWKLFDVRSSSGLRAQRGPCRTGREASCCTVLCAKTVIILTEEAK